MKSYLYRYMATCVPGIENIVADEIKEVLKNVNNISPTRGKTTFDCPSFDNTDYNNLKCADNIYKLFRVFSLGPHKEDLSEIGDFVKDIDFDTAGTPRIIVSASRTGKHTYSRYDIANQVEHSLISTGRYVIGDNLNHDIAVRVDVLDNTCKIYKQLTSSQMRFRGGDFQSVPGGIRPSLAHCLVRLSDPKNNDVFYDPFCGAGTIPFERSGYKSKKIFASDYDDNILEVAKTNLKKSAIVFCADATQSKMKDNSVNKIVTNMPWGKQIKVENINGLYHDFLKELKRILTTNGKAILLTDQVSVIEDLCVELNLNCSRLAELSLHGLHPVVFDVSKL